MTTRWRVVAVALLTAGTVLTACSDENQPSTSLPDPTTASASPTLPPLGPADFPVPTEARAQTAEGVTAFANYYVDLANYSLKILDPTYLRALSKNCDFCASLADSYESARAKGYRYSGGQLTIESAGSAVVNGNTGETSFLLGQSPVRVFDAARPVPEKSAAAMTYSGGMRLEWDADRVTWLVSDLEADPQ